MRKNPSFYVHQFNYSGRLREIQESLDGSGYAADVLPNFETGETGSTYVGILLNPKGAITHICRLNRGKIAGVGLRSVFFSEINKISSKDAEIVRKSIKMCFHNRRKIRNLYSGLKLTNNENVKVISHIEKTAPALANRLRSLGRADTKFLDRYTAKEAETLVLERDALGAALDIAFDNRDLLRVNLQPKAKVNNFLALVDGVGSIEDEFIAYDKDRFPDMRKFGVTPRRATFVSGGERLEVIHANRNKLETTLGADLIYYHTRFGLILCVQYKMLKKTSDGFQLQSNQKFQDQMAKMIDVECQIAKTPSSGTERDYRLCSSPFFYKFIYRLEKNFADNALCPGLYMPIGLVKQLASAKPPVPIGADDSKITRHFANSDFARLVREGWIGCYSSQINTFETLIKQSLEAGRSVMAAIGDQR